MSVTSFIRRCLDAGMPIDLALAAGEAFEVEAPLYVPAKTKGAERMARYRARKSSQPSPSVTCDDSDKDVSPTPPSENPTLPKGPLKGPQKVSRPSISLEKPNAELTKPLSVWVSEIWEITPRPGRERSGKPRLENAIRAAMRRGADPAAIKRGCEGYFASDDATKSAGQFCQGVHTVIGSGRWETFAEDEPAALPSDTDPWPRRLHGWRANQYWNSEWGPKPGREGYLGPPEQQARAA